MVTARRERIVELLMRSVTDREMIARDLAERGLLVITDEASAKAAALTIKLDIFRLRKAAGARLTRVGEYEAAREELIEWATKIRDLAWSAKNPDAALRAALIVARAKGFDVATAPIRIVADAPAAKALADEERAFVRTLPLELRRKYVLWTEGRLEPEEDPAKLLPMDANGGEAN